MKGKTIGLITALLVIALGLPAQAATTKANVYRFMDGSKVAGASSVLSTTDAGARLQLHTSDLPDGHAITVLFVIFNEPQNCTHGESGLRCGPGDLPPYGGDDSAVTSIVSVAGHVVGGSGRATFAGRVATGDTDAALFGPGLINPTTADIHVIVRDDSDSGAFLQFSPHQQ